MQTTTESTAVVLRIHRGGFSSLNHQDGEGSESDRSKATAWSMGRKLAKLTKETKAAKTLGIVMGVFILCWLPFFFTSVLFGVWPHPLISAHHQELIESIVTWLGWLNSGMNPVIYACWSRDFRRAFEKILCGHCCRKRRERKSRALAFARYTANDRAHNRDSNSSSSTRTARESRRTVCQQSSLPMATLSESIVAATATSVSAIAVAEVVPAPED